MKKLLLLFCLFFISFSSFSQNQYFAYWRAQTALRKLQYDSAKVWAQEAQKEMLNDYRPFLLLARIALAQKDSLNAQHFFLKSNELEPNVASLYLAKLAVSAHNDSLAIVYLQELQSSNYRLETQKLQDIKEFRGLHHSPHWKQILQIDARSAEKQWFDRCQHVLQKADYLTLDQLADSAIQQTNWTAAHWFKACSWKGFSNNRIERKELLLALQKSPRNGIYLAALARNYVAEKEYDKSIKYLSDAINVLPDSCMLLYYRATIFLQNKQFQHAKTDIETLLQIQPQNDTLWYMAGQIEASQRNTLAALPYLNKAIEINPSQGEYFKCRGNTLFDSESFELAERSFSMALDVAPTDGTLYFNRALCRLRLHDNTKACYDFRRAAQLGIVAAQTYIPKSCEK